MAAGWLGTPVCIAIQTTQIINPHPEKNNKVNQSIREATGRLRVGKAKAANEAMAGKAKSSVLSDEPVVNVATKVTPMNHSGNTKWRLI